MTATPAALTQIACHEIGGLLDRYPDVDPESLIADGWDGATELVRRYVEGGLTKFVLRPAGPVADWPGFLHEFTSEMGPLQD